MAGTPLAEGIRLFQSPLWQTNSVLAEREGEVLLADPALFVPELEAIRDEVARRGPSAVRLLLTHGDFDHTCGIPWFPSAEVIAGTDTAEVVASGAAAEQLVASGPEWGADWRTELRVDRTVAPGDVVACGPWTVEVIGAPSHGREGVAFAVLEEGLLLAGDHLSSITIPLVVDVARTAAANERMLEALGRLDLSTVVPGHGPAHSPEEARAIGEADLAYLRALQDSARSAVADGLPSGPALVRVFEEVEPPRGDTSDFAVYGIRAGNARQALAEAA